MGAPTKEGLDYFSFDVDLLDNDDIDFLREKYGVVVNDVYIALLTLLYRKKGYYIPYETEEEKKECVWYIYKRVRGGKHSVQQETISRVIEALVAQGLFDSNLFAAKNDHCNKIITSERAQKVYYKATVERQFESFNIKPEYWLLNEETMRKLSKVHPYYLSMHPESKSGEKPSKSGEKPSKSGEKPLNKSKSISNDIQVSKKVSKKEENNHASAHAYTYDEIFEDFNVSQRLKDALIEFIKHLKSSYKIVMLNDRLENLIIALDMKYGQDDGLKVKEVREAVVNGYRRLGCESVNQTTTSL